MGADDGSASSETPTDVSTGRFSASTGIHSGAGWVSTTWPFGARCFLATVVATTGLEVKALFDSGSTESFIHPRLVEKAALTIHPSSGTVSMATSVSSTVSITGTCTTNLTYQGREYAGYRLPVLPGLCADLILDLDFQSQHSSVTVDTPEVIGEQYARFKDYV